MKTVNAQVSRDLELLQETSAYRRWLHRLIAPYLGTRILEIGCGIGNYTEFLLQHGAVLATDMEPSYVQRVAARFQDHATCKTGVLDATACSEQQYACLQEFDPDTLVCLNVLEHIEEDVAVVRSFSEWVHPGGNLIFIVPALPVLFSPLDTAYGHHRRYRRSDIDRLCKDKKRVAPVYVHQFNLPGALGWWFSHVLLKRKGLQATQVRLFDRLVPCFSTLERMVSPAFGLSQLMVLRCVR